ncbi:hypothetical protein BaRGS_00002109 [Batillaria attramentaria]|uniref:Uncharacterized protein n=1 Tax=Batillaria attramentaria TaxID=370345 RepID=A0ABD0M5G0_9CAEN
MRFEFQGEEAVSALHSVFTVCRACGRWRRHRRKSPTHVQINNKAVPTLALQHNIILLQLPSTPPPSPTPPPSVSRPTPTPEHLHKKKKYRVQLQLHPMQHERPIALNYRPAEAGSNKSQQMKGVLLTISTPA